MSHRRSTEDYGYQLSLLTHAVPTPQQPAAPHRMSCVLASTWLASSSLRCPRGGATRRSCVARGRHTVTLKNVDANGTRAQGTHRKSEGVECQLSVVTRNFSGAFATVAAAVTLAATPNPALAAFGQSVIELNNITYETIPCPKGKVTMTIGKATCLRVLANSVSPSKDIVYNADVFGRVSDAAGDNALDRDEASDAGRIANIAEVPPGEGKVTFDITVSRCVTRAADGNTFTKERVFALRFSRLVASSSVLCLSPCSFLFIPCRHSPLSVRSDSEAMGRLKFMGFKAKSYPGGAFKGNSPLLGVEEEGCDIFSSQECADRYFENQVE